MVEKTAKECNCYSLLVVLQRRNREAAVYEFFRGGRRAPGGL